VLSHAESSSRAGKHLGLQRGSRGTTFKIYLPRVDDVIEEHPVWEAAAASTRTETILVEDSDSERELGREILEAAGYDLDLRRPQGRRNLEVTRPSSPRPWSREPRATGGISR
jgi:hypothetical protein